MKNTNLQNNTRKNNQFVVIGNIVNGKPVYNKIVYMTKTVSEGLDFIHLNYTKSVPACVKSYSELVKSGVPQETLNNFTNPKIY